MSKTVGVLGGMGPEATASFFERLIELTPARRDQDHLEVLVVSNPKIPDRTLFLSGAGESPLPLLLHSARRLESMGADFIAIPCNTAHYFWQEVSDSVRLPVLNIIQETVGQILKKHPDPSRLGSVAVLATEGTLTAGLYQKALHDRNVNAIQPEPRFQRKITRAIACVKGKKSRQEAAHLLAEVIEHSRSNGAGAAILGCTELGLIPVRPTLPLFDSLQILAESSVALALEAGPFAQPASLTC